MLDVIKFYQANHIPYRESGNEHCGPGWVQIDCPWCNERDAWHLGFNLNKGRYHCWHCGGKKVWDTVGMLLKTNRGDIIGNAIKTFQKAGSVSAATAVVRNRTIEPPLGAGPLSAPHRRYLRQRGFDPLQLAADWGLLGTRHLSKTWNWRIVIPVHDFDGRIVAYQGRSIANADPKYRMSRDEEILIDPKSMLYGTQKAGDAVLVVEGVPLVWKFGPGCIATLGIDWKRQQANRIRRYKRRYIMFDPEPKAQQQAERLAAWLSPFPGTTEILDGFDTDLDRLSFGAAKKLMTELGL